MLTLSRKKIKVIQKQQKNRKANYNMGYTHYWDYNPRAATNSNALKERFAYCSKQVEEAYQYLIKHPFAHRGQHGGFYDDKPCIIRGSIGEGEPVFSDTRIWFNGDETSEMSHETFWVDVENEVGFGFCKTARKPYDLLVCFSLLVLKKYLGEKVFNFSSDGDEEDWASWHSYPTPIPIS